jgi:serine/threonine-protein kinase
MGVVFQARHLGLDTHVAIKFLNEDALLDTSSTARLRREARATAKIGGAHVARILDVGTLETGGPFVVMELLAGRDLGALARERGRLPVSEAVSYVRQACDGVGCAHELGIVHRDLKPSNLFLAREGGLAVIKVLDFGLSKVGDAATGSRAQRLTATDALVGSPVYMSPEQIGDPRAVDARSDVWSLGVILYELLTARFPFEGNTLPQVCTLILHGRPRALSELRPDVSPALVGLIERCLSKDAARRPADARALGAALDAILPSAAGTTETSRGRRTGAARAIVVCAAILAVVVVSLAAWRAARSTRGGGAAAASSPSSTASLNASTCDMCVAANCGNEVQACESSPACKGALGQYDDCVAGRGKTDVAACAETLGTSPAPEAQRLAGCVFVRVGGPTLVPGKCATACTGTAIGGACSAYCTCMRDTCEKILPIATCAQSCAALTPEQVRCRTFHCALASQGQPELHCRHAVGQLQMCE